VTDNDPRKKAKREDTYELDEAMPGYHEFDETDCKAPEDECELEGNFFEAEVAAPVSRPPHSTTGARSSSNVRSDTRPRSQSETSHSAKPAQRCPICDKDLVVDNADFNAHIDFCLSRGAIMQAQREARKSASTSTLRVDSKPRSVSKRGGDKR
jgi:DNA polymerase kappa